MHTMTYFQDKSLITITGGRNDQLSNIILGDLWVLKLDDLEYQRVIIKSDLQVIPRYNHTAVQFGSKLIVFGGMNQDMTLEMSVQEFELDSNIIERKIKRHEALEENRKRMKQMENRYSTMSLGVKNKSKDF